MAFSTKVIYKITGFSAGFNIHIQTFIFPSEFIQRQPQCDILQRSPQNFPFRMIYLAIWHIPSEITSVWSFPHRMNLEKITNWTLAAVSNKPKEKVFKPQRVHLLPSNVKWKSRRIIVSRKLSFWKRGQS